MRGHASHVWWPLPNYASLCACQEALHLRNRPPLADLGADRHRGRPAFRAAAALPRPPPRNATPHPLRRTLQCAPLIVLPFQPVCPLNMHVSQACSPCVVVDGMGTRWCVLQALAAQMEVLNVAPPMPGQAGLDTRTLPRPIGPYAHVADSAPLPPFMTRATATLGTPAAVMPDGLHARLSTCMLT